MKFVRLGDVARIVGGGSLVRSNSACWNGSIPWVTAMDIRGARINDPLAKITEFGLKESASNLLPVGSILVPASMTFENVVINDVPVAINKDLTAIIVESPAIDRNYIQLFLLSKTNNLELYGKVGMKNGGDATEVLADIDIPLQPLEEQRRIALILDKADAIRKKRRATLNLADSFLHSIFLDKFGEPVMNPKELPVPPIAVQKRYTQIHNKMISIKEKLATELVQSNMLFNSLAASVFTSSEAA
jgi:type I restriction enzyme S subunit